MLFKGVIKKAFTLVELVVAMTVSTIVLAGVSGVLVFFNSFFNKSTKENTALIEALNIKKNLISYFDEVGIKENLELDTSLNDTKKGAFYSFKNLEDKSITLFNNVESKLIEVNSDGVMDDKFIATYSAELTIRFILENEASTSYNKFIIERKNKDGSKAEVINFSYYLN